MSDSRLIKEFSRKDVQRLRNLYSGKAGDATTTQVGYTKKEQERQEGDVWTEDGKEWTIKGGIKQTHTHLDGIKKLLSTPMLCPQCGNRLKTATDKKMYHLQGKCFGCVQEYETHLKLNGGYQEYANEIMYKNAATFVEEAREYIEEIKNQTHGVFTESGQQEEWTGPSINQLAIDKMQEELKELEETIKSKTNEQQI